MVNLNNQHQETANKEWLPTQEIKNNAKTSPSIFKRVINSAIYVEKPASATFSNTSIRLPQKLSSTDFLEIKTKRCTCSTDRQTCSCHSNSLIASADSEKPIVPNLKLSSKKSQNSTKISQNIKNSDTIKLEKQRTIKSAAPKKDTRAKNKDISEDARVKEEQIKQQQENFQKWLLNKKQIELRNKKKKEKEMEEQELKELEKEKKHFENQLNFQLWLKKKEEIHLEKRIKKQIESIYDLERKQQQLKDNEKAFKEWLQNSKNKQKPVPLNRGIQSLRSANSVTYVNPNPWNPSP